MCNIGYIARRSAEAFLVASAIVVSLAFCCQATAWADEAGQALAAAEPQAVQPAPDPSGLLGAGDPEPQEGEGAEPDGASPEPEAQDGGCSYSFVNQFIRLTTHVKAMLAQTPQTGPALLTVDGSAR